MERIWIYITLLLTVLLVSCQETQGVLKGPSPKVGTPDRPLSAGLRSDGPINISLAELLDDPRAYKDQILQISGTFHIPQPFPCETKAYRSPATWSLSAGNQEALAAGPSDTAPDLPTESVQVTVEGRWRRWVGLRGCGEQALPAEVWYLETTEILFPEDFSAILVSADQEGTQVAGDFNAEVPESIGKVTPTSTQAEDPYPALPTVTSALVPSADASTSQSGFAAQDGMPTTTQTSPTPIPTATSTGGSITPSPTIPITSTVTPIPTPQTPTTATQGDVRTMPTLNIGSLEIGQLAANSTNLWPYEIDEAQVITVQIAPVPELEITVAIQDGAGRSIAEEEPAQPGQSVIMDEITLNDPGTYEISVSSSPASSGDYAILIGEEASYQFSFRGFLEDGFVHDAELEPESDHFWHFVGVEDEVIDISVSPYNLEDLFLRLFGPDGSLLVEFHDEEGPGQSENLSEFILEASGLYSLVVGESDFEAAEYIIEMSKS